MSNKKISNTSILAESKVISKGYFRVFVLLLNTLVWWYLALGVVDILIDSVQTTVGENLELLTAFYGAAIGASIAGSFLSRKLSRIRAIYYWLGLGITSSLLPALFNYTSFLQVLGVCLFLGMSFGIGMPSCFAYFAQGTAIEARGRMGGIIFFFTNLSAPFLYVAFGMFNLAISSIGLTVWRAVGTIAFFLLRPSEPVPSKEKQTASLRSLFENKAFGLYLLAWAMFCFIDRLNEPVLRNFFGEDLTRLIVTTTPFISGISALIGGLLCDWIGRKRIVVYGFVSMGISYALIGLFPGNPVSWYLYSAIDGIAWGLFMVSFVLTVWGDLAEKNPAEAYYMIGSIPFFITDLAKMIATPYVLLIPEYATFSLASLLLFLAILPLIYAPETLPERKIELRRLRKYVEKAKKISGEYSEKSEE